MLWIEESLHLDRGPRSEFLTEDSGSYYVIYQPYSQGSSLHFYAFKQIKEA